MEITVLRASPSTQSKLKKKNPIRGHDYADSLVICYVPDIMTTSSTAIFLHLILTNAWYYHYFIQVKTGTEK